MPGHGPGNLLLVTFITCSMQSTSLSAASGTPEKVGAGLLLCCEGKVLLLKRNSKHNDQAWGLPGGNVEAGDEGLLGTAAREAYEELGQVPPFEVKAQLLTRRGKRSQKHYTVFVADVKPLVLASYTPNLNLAEHSEWRWWSWESVVAAVAGEGAAGGEMHPVVKKLVEEHSAEVEHVLQSCVQ